MSRGNYTLPAERLHFLDEEPELETQELGDGLFTISDGKYRTVYVLGEREAFAWDTLGSPGRARAYARAVGGPIRTIVYSNDHLDRSGFSADLAADAKVLAHERCAKVVELRQADGQRPATRRFGDREQLQAAGAQLIFPGPVSATGNVATYFPGRRVLYFPDTVIENARYSMLPDWNIHNFSPSLRSLLELDFDTFVPGRWGLMTKAGFERGIDFLDAVHATAQLAFAESVAVWMYDAITEYAKGKLAGDWGHLDGFDDDIGIMTFRMAHHYLMGGYSTEDTPAGKLQPLA
jgi:hypothetical protein